MIWGDSMTYIEFYETDAIENLCGCLTNAPERVILVGKNRKQMQKQADRYHAFFESRGKNVEFLCKSVNRNNLQFIVEVLSQIVKEYDDCVLDLTGGEDLYLVAAGIVSERYGGLQMHRFNIHSGAIVDCDQDGTTILKEAFPALTVEENIRIYGGDVVYSDVKADGTFRWDLSDEFKADVEAMWKVCKVDAKQWNKQIGVFAAAQKQRDTSQDPLTTVALVSAVQEELNNNGGKYVTERRIYEELYQAGLLTAYYYDDALLTVTYKNEQVKRCLTKAGTVLELKFYLMAQKTRDEDGTLTYQSVMNGVYIDWDGEVQEGEDGTDTHNEIDVMMMRGMVPVFVSCKNGRVDKNELYKLSTVANRFGGKYAKKVLVTTALHLDPAADSIRQRAKEMDIQILEGIQNKPDEALEKDIRTIWCS